MTQEAGAAVDHHAAGGSSVLGDEPKGGLVIGGVDLEDAHFVAKRRLQIFLDKISFYPGRRWAAFGVALSIFLLRIYIKQGYAALAYVLGLYILQKVMLYLTPAEMPNIGEETDIDMETFVLPTRENDEYKGFNRKLREMDFWKSLMTATSIVAFLSLFQATDIPIHWQLLVAYFLFVTCFLCRVKIEHMIKYQYIPFEIGKKSYGKPKKGEGFAKSHFDN